MNILSSQCIRQLFLYRKESVLIATKLPIIKAQRALSGAVLVQAFPKRIQPYLRLMRVDKPTGFWLLYWPCTWSIALATPPGSLPDLKMLALFGAGSILMRSAGCIVNDIFDRDYDRMVERTQSRPLASGELTDRQAVALLALLLSGSLSILLQFSWFSVAVGASSLSLVVVYPLAKRYTYWPQLVLGLTSNWGVFIAWCHLCPNTLLTVIPLYIATVFYTVIYDTIYSQQDKTDDLIVGIKSTALLFGDKTKYWLTGFGALTLLGLVTTGVMVQQTWPFYNALAATGAHLAWQIGTVNINDPNDCWKKFKTNQWLGIILFTGIVAGNLLRKKEEIEANSIILENVK
uniref:4-hydroxybenzoate polyprenyltransferase, mitochondrial n=1 Tax=Onchocerca volvulus TaxID=6282 RepID=A0A8R1Y2D8_ONCVO